MLCGIVTSSSTIVSMASLIVIVVCLLLGRCSIILLLCRGRWCRGYGHGWHMVDHWWRRQRCIVLDWRRRWELDVCRYLILLLGIGCLILGDHGMEAGDFLEYGMDGHVLLCLMALKEGECFC